MLRNILLVTGMVGLIYIGINIEKPFWSEIRFQEEVGQVQKNGNFVPYRLRKVLFNQYITIIKTETERTLNWLWLDKFWGILPICIIIAFKKRRRLPIFLIVTGVALMVVENNPNTSYYFWFLIPTICAIFF